MIAHPKPLASLSSALLGRSPGDRRKPRPMALGTMTSVARTAVAEVAPEVPTEDACHSATPAKTRRIAFTLRLDQQRHARLKQASAKSGRSAQQFLTEALDAFLQTLPEEDAFDAPSDDGQHVNRWGSIR